MEDLDTEYHSVILREGCDLFGAFMVLVFLFPGAKWVQFQE